MCDQQRLGPACAYAQTDQSLCWSLEFVMTVKLLTEQTLEFLSLTRGYTSSSETTLVKMPHCWKSHVTAQIRNTFSRDVAILEPIQPTLSLSFAFKVFRFTIYSNSKIELSTLGLQS